MYLKCLCYLCPVSVVSMISVACVSVMYIVCLMSYVSIGPMLYMSYVSVVSILSMSCVSVVSLYLCPMYLYSITISQPRIYPRYNSDSLDYQFLNQDTIHPASIPGTINTTTTGRDLVISM